MYIYIFEFEKHHYNTTLSIDFGGRYVDSMKLNLTQVPFVPRNADTSLLSRFHLHFSKSEADPWRGGVFASRQRMVPDMVCGWLHYEQTAMC